MEKQKTKTTPKKEQKTVSNKQFSSYVQTCKFQIHNWQPTFKFLSYFVESLYTKAEFQFRSFFQTVLMWILQRVFYEDCLHHGLEFSLGVHVP